MPRSSFVRALYEFANPESGEIHLKVGDVVQVIGDVNESWQIGRNHSQSGETGNFPKNFVEALKIPSLEMGQKLFLAAQSFNGEMKEDLSFSRGDLILGLSMINSMWWNGKSGDRIGIFPLTFTTELLSYSEEVLSERSELGSDAVASPGDSGLVAAEPVSTREPLRLEETPLIAKGRATMDLDAQLDDELSFKKDDVICIIRQIDDVFALGQIDSKIGQFPLAFVDIFEGSISDSLAERSEAGRSAKKFDWWRDPDAEKGILEKVALSEAELTPSFEEQTAPIVLDDEYSLNTSHAFYSKAVDSSTDSSQLLDRELLSHLDSNQNLVTANTLYKFPAENDNELGFEPGELVIIIRNIDGQWLEGEIGGRRGIFPASYVRILDRCKSTTEAIDKSLGNSSDCKLNCFSDDTEFKELPEKQNNSLDRNQLHENQDIPELHRVMEKPLDTPLDEVHKESDVLLKCSSPAAIPPDACTGDGGAGISAEAVSGSSELDKTPVEEGRNFSVSAELPSDENHRVETSCSDVEVSSTIVPVCSAESETKMPKDSASSEESLEVLCQLSSEQIASGDVVCESGSAVVSGRNESENPQLERGGLDNDDQCQHHPSSSVGAGGAPGDGTDRTSDVTMSSDPSLSTAACSSEIKSSVDPKSDRPMIKPKPQIKPKPDPARVKPISKNTDCETTPTTEVPKRHPLKKGVSFCLDNVIVYPRDSIHEDTDFAAKRRNSESHKLVEELKNHLPEIASRSESVDSTKNSSSASFVSSPTSPTSDCHYDGNSGTVHFRKVSSQAPLPKPTRPPQSVTSKKKTATEKETRSETDGLKFGQSQFYAGSMATAVAAPPTSPSSSKKVPPHPTKPKTAKGDTVLPNGIFYTSLFDSQPKPVPCRPAPPRPSAVPPSAVSSPPPPAMPEEIEDDSDENLDVIRDTERRISEIENDLENLQREESVLSSQLVEAAVNEREIIAEKIEFCRVNATGLSEELNQLKENLSHLRPTQLRLPVRPRPDERFSKERAEMAKKHQEELRRKRVETRIQVIQEIIRTEHDYLQSLCLCLETFFNCETLEVKCPSSVDLGLLFGNIYEVVELSQKFINLLETNALGKSFEEQQIGICFEELKEELKRVYAIYCRNHDDVIMQLEKYETQSEAQEYFALMIAQMRIHATVFDVGSILIKPVQRILKYPLLLQELQKTTEKDHPDSRHLEAALKAMTDVASYINEFKRRKDLVLKYKNSTDVSLRDMLSRLTVHSYRKKLGRLSMMVSGTLAVDEKFSQEELKFNALEEGILLVLQNVSNYLDFLQKSLAAMETVANDTADYYGLNRSEYEVDLFCRTLNGLTHTLFAHFKSQVQSDVLPPLNGLMTLFPGPQKLIKKRYHKLLDYENAKLKQKNVRDADQVKLTKIEVQSCKSNYEALNLQLLEDLPRFYALGVSIISDSLRQFVFIQAGFWSSTQREISRLLKMKCVGDHSKGIVETFNIAHTEVVDRLSDLILIPKSFNPLIDEKRRQIRRQSSDFTSAMSGDLCSELTTSRREILLQNHPPGELYVVSEDFHGTQVMDLKISRGTVVAVIKESDPMGNVERFLVTDGVSNGFVPKRLLSAFSDPASDEISTQLSLNDSMRSTSSAGSSSSSLVSDFLTPVAERVLDFVELTENEPPSDAVDSNGQISFQTLESGFRSQEESSDDLPADKMLYRAEYVYVAESDFEVAMTIGEIVQVLKQQDVSGNGDWWLVEKDDGKQGYVPANFLSKVEIT